MPRRGATSCRLPPPLPAAGGAGAAGRPAGRVDRRRGWRSAGRQEVADRGPGAAPLLAVRRVGRQPAEPGSPLGADLLEETSTSGLRDPLDNAEDRSEDRKLELRLGVA